MTPTKLEANSESVETSKQSVETNAAFSKTHTYTTNQVKKTNGYNKSFWGNFLCSTKCSDETLGDFYEVQLTATACQIKHENGMAFAILTMSWQWPLNRFFSSALWDTVKIAVMLRLTKSEFFEKKKQTQKYVLLT